MKNIKTFPFFWLPATGYLGLYDLNKFAAGERLNDLNDLSNGPRTTDNGQSGSCLLPSGLYLPKNLVRCRQCFINVFLFVGQADKGRLEL